VEALVQRTRARRGGGRWNLGRSLVMSALVLALAGIGILVPATPSSAANGGCSDSPIQQGWQMSVCVSTTGWRVSGDVYIKRQGSGSCQVTYRLWDSTTGDAVGGQSGVQDCFVGRHPEIHFDGEVPGHRYYNNAIIWINGDNPVLSWRSDDLTCC
jgi:hypothetical protein